MSKKAIFVMVLVVGISAGLLAVKIGDGLTAPREPVEITQEVTLSLEGWEQLEEMLNR